LRGGGAPTVGDGVTEGLDACDRVDPETDGDGGVSTRAGCTCGCPEGTVPDETAPPAADWPRRPIAFAIPINVTEDNMTRLLPTKR